MGVPVCWYALFYCKCKKIGNFLASFKNYSYLRTLIINYKPKH